MLSGCWLPSLDNFFYPFFLLEDLFLVRSLARSGLELETLNIFQRTPLQLSYVKVSMGRASTKILLNKIVFRKKS